MSIVKAREFLRRGARADGMPLVLLVGRDRYWRDRCREKVVSSWVHAAGDPWSVRHLSLRETNIAAAFAEAQSAPLLCARQVVIVEAVDTLERCEEKEREEACEFVRRYVSQPATFTFLLFEADSCDQRTKFYRLMRDTALVVELEGQEGTSTVVEMARAAECGIDAEGAELLVEMCGADGGLMEREILKLATFVGERRRITRDDVRRLVVASESGSAWDLTDALLAGRVRESLQLVDRLLLRGESGVKLVGALAWTYRKLIEARDLPESISSYQAAQRLGMRPDTAVSLVRKAHRFDHSRAAGSLVLMAEADRLLKSSGADERTVLEFLVVRLCQNEWSGEKHR